MLERRQQAREGEPRATKLASARRARERILPRSASCACKHSRRVVRFTRRQPARSEHGSADPAPWCVLATQGSRVQAGDARAPIAPVAVADVTPANGEQAWAAGRVCSRPFAQANSVASAATRRPRSGGVCVQRPSHASVTHRRRWRTLWRLRDRVSSPTGSAGGRAGGPGSGDGRRRRGAVARCDPPEHALRPSRPPDAAASTRRSHAGIVLTSPLGLCPPPR
jgi:hypothetical protein